MEMNVHIHFRGKKTKEPEKQLLKLIFKLYEAVSSISEAVQQK
jgi:hypothetical protein